MMSEMKENIDEACYFITKHSWKGKYKRVFSIGTLGITTYNPSTMEITNQWLYEDFVSIVPYAKSNNEFVITIKKGLRKTDTMKFSTDHRSDLLTDALAHRHSFAEKNFQTKRFNAFKHHWSDNRQPILLEVNQGSLDQRDTLSSLLASYCYKDIESLILVSDCPGGLIVVHGGFSRLHLFALEKRSELITAVQEAACGHVGINLNLKKEPVSMEIFVLHRLGKYSTDESLTSHAEFIVMKVSHRHPDPVRRLLCLTESCLVERDPSSYSVVTVKPLCDIFAIIRDQNDPQMVSVEYVKGAIRYYRSTDRDACIASLLDGVRASGNRDVCVKMRKTSRGLRLGPFIVPVDEEVESQHMRHIQSQPNGMTFAEAVNRFNCNISYSGLLHSVTGDRLFAENKEKLINLTLKSLMENEGDQESLSAQELEDQLQALRRLVASKAGFQAFTILPMMREKLGLKVVKTLQRNNDGLTHSAIDMINALMQPMHDDYDLRQEQLNKSSLMSSKSFMTNLLDIFKKHVLGSTGSLVIAALLDFMTFALCAPYSETTDGALFDTFLELVSSRGRMLFHLFQHPSIAIVKGAGLVMRALVEEGDAEVAAKMQDLALAEGALPRHLHAAMFTVSSDNRLLTMRQLSRHLVGLWSTGHPTTMALLRRILPMGLLQYLDSTAEVPEDDTDRLLTRDNLKLAQEGTNAQRKLVVELKRLERQMQKHFDVVLTHWRSKMGLEVKASSTNEPKPIVLRKRRQRIKSEANWALFYYHFNRDHSRSNLIWNQKTRDELRSALEEEIRSFGQDRDLSASTVVSWNHAEFELRYGSLSDEIRIGDYYLRLLLEEDEKEESSMEEHGIKNSIEFFNDLYHRFLLAPKTAMKCTCLHAMTVVYSRCYEEIGSFNDTRYIVAMLERCSDRLERDRLLLFIGKLINVKRNVKELMDVGGVRILTDLLTLAHLHVSRACVPLQTNVIEASADMKRESEKEWYYGNADKERLGPYSLEEMTRFYDEKVIHMKTRCWAQGMEGWRPLGAVPQLKWTLQATGQAVLNPTELASLILSMFIKMCSFYPSRDVDGAVVRPLPRIKRLLSEPVSLPHIVQLLLTFDPSLVERVSLLLHMVMEDNPVLSRLYLTGVFFFILMYTGSNVLPIARFLKYAHLRQAFRSEELSDVIQNSVLGHLLPEAMVCYLENHPEEKFSEIFLGEFDTPEAIWSNEMRRLMIEKIASHLADFSPRLQSNTRALYQYCPIPVVTFPQLESELFCNIYYLRHLCDTSRFPDWPIKDPIKLLRNILEAWKLEVEKKPPAMSAEEAFQVLGLQTGIGGHDESKVRKAYFRLAQKYHPDKNPTGRDIFDKVSRAYEFLCSQSKLTQGPDPKNIVLILRAQSIIFSRYKEVLAPYKYAGYPMLIKTIQMETHDDALFSKSSPLLSAASELCYHTVNCCALNAEELRRENGIIILQEAFSRCVSVVGSSSKPADIAVQICTHISRCYGVASQFEGCREKIQETPEIVKDLIRLLYFKSLVNLHSVIMETIGCFCVDTCLQTALFHSGVLWPLICFLFNYDFTLEESGLEKSADSNQQEASNRLAHLSTVGCARLAGLLQGDEATPENMPVKKSLSALLMPYVMHKISENDPKGVLKLLNSNCESPYLLWDNSCRQELIEYAADQQTSVFQSGLCDESFGSDFVYSLHEKELIIGDIFVRVYNEQPLFPLDNAKGFTIDLLDYIGSQAQYLHSLMSLQPGMAKTTASPERLKNVEMSLEALRNVLRKNAGVEIQCIGHFKLLFSLLRVDGCASIQQYSLEVLSCVAANVECVNDIAASDVITFLLLLFKSLPDYHQTTLKVTHSLCSDSKLLKELLSKGCLIYLLDLFCNSSLPAVREQTAQLFAKMISDKLTGPKIRLILAKFLPPIFMDAMRDSAEASVHMFEGVHENPELIWNLEAREKVCRCLQKMSNNLYKLQLADPLHKCNIPDNFDVVYSNQGNELVVAGVFLRLFVANPGWVLRRPKEFLIEMLEKWSHMASSPTPNGEMLELLTSALVGFIQAQPSMLPQVPQLGYTPKIAAALSSVNTAVPKSAIRIVHQLSANEGCVSVLVQAGILSGLQKGMKICPDAIGLACEALHRMCGAGDDELVQQALNSQLIAFMMTLLDSSLKELPNPTGTKAQIVKALKAMQRSLKYGQQVCMELEKHPIWKEYRDQKHDLFISDRPTAGAITGPAVAGYLTSSTSNNQPAAALPPPMD